MKLNRHGRVWLATAVWIAVALMLIWRGVFPHFSNIEAGWAKVVTLVAAIVVGLAKGVFVISKSAARTAAYIRRRPERDWIWNALHPILYLLIPVMILMGIMLKRWCKDDAPALVVGVYVGIGAALLVGSRGFFAALRD